MLDKLEFDGKQVNIVDYKTGNPDNSIQKIRGRMTSNPWEAITGDRLFLQMR
jgi:DNA helicase-2/ATP-dependent DNA helicase PcrA